MENIENVKIVEMKKSNFVQPYRILYKQVKKSFNKKIDLIANFHFFYYFIAHIFTNHCITQKNICLILLISLQNQKDKIWDGIKVHDSVSVLIYNVTRKKIILVKQFRPGLKFAVFFFFF